MSQKVDLLRRGLLLATEELLATAPSASATVSLAVASFAGQSLGVRTSQLLLDGSLFLLRGDPLGSSLTLGRINSVGLLVDEFRRILVLALLLWFR